MGWSRIWPWSWGRQQRWKPWQEDAMLAMARGSSYDSCTTGLLLLNSSATCFQ